MGKFEGKTVMITGASGALGSVAARRFAAEGARLVLVDRIEEHLDKLIEELGAQHMKAMADLGQADDVGRLIEQLEADGVRIDVLIHTVGGYAGGTPVHEASIEEFEKQFYINTRAIFVTCGRVARHMIQQGIKGKIVVTLSKAAEKGVKNSAASSASKAAAKSLVESMAQELQQYSININGVSPSTLDTEANRRAMPNADFSTWVNPDDIVDAFMFLASEEAQRIRGVNLTVYG
ncbi:MAG: 3-oxoacyl-ACP reductase [Phototrophicales bacterium]|nr:MAG: 3-oxoacyl-ACP reductase [Phototrophicales bacterium]